MKRIQYLYHYTNINALKGILRSKTLWLTSCENYTDVEAEDRALKEVINYGLNNEQIFKEVIVGHLNIYADLDEDNHEKIINEVVKLRKNTYMLCLSETKDNKHLWDNYANKNDNGVILELDRGYLPHMKTKAGYKNYTLTSSVNGKRSSEYRLVDMVYGRDKFIEAIQAYFKSSCPLVLPFYIDEYKDIQYEAEKEKRLLVYVSDTGPKSRNSLSFKIDGKFENDDEETFNQRNIIYNETDNRFELKLTAESYKSNYNFIDQTCAVRKVYCKSSEILKLLNKLKRSVNGDFMIEKIN
ncbi:MAG: hypothetical protein EP298_00155 [Gammaproteobacteria bacterium]|nr:MAG: hypothetical protein EP298_00155 [Gammaproteobacteria bacterium]UTW43154.1 hypothetical protein KFE69_03135 [bacterium SCSIO 12844]